MPITGKLIAPYCKELIFLEVNSLEDLTKEKFLQKIFESDVSYLPVFKNRRTKYLGTLSRKKYLYTILKEKPFNVFDILDHSVRVIKEDEPLHNILRLMRDAPGLLLTVDGRIDKFVSPRVVANAFQEYTSKLFLIENLEISLRKKIASNQIDFIEVLKSKNQEFINGGKKLKEINDLTFSDYNLIFSANWDKLSGTGIIDRKSFFRSLKAVSEIRNDVFHFRNQLTFDEIPFKNLLRWLS